MRMALPVRHIAVHLRGACAMEHQMYPDTTKELAQRRREAAPEILSAFRAFGQRVFADGALPANTKQLIAVAVAHVTQCPYCIRGHTGAALRAGARPEAIMEATWVAAERRAGRLRPLGARAGHDRECAAEERPGSLDSYCSSVRSVCRSSAARNGFLRVASTPIIAAIERYSSLARFASPDMTTIWVAGHL